MTICEHVVVAPDESPFDRMLVTGYYDGPTDGFVECRQCARVYGFRKLAWDRDQDVRIYALLPIDEDFERVGQDLLGRSASAKQVQVVPPLASEQAQRLENLMSRPAAAIIAATNLRRGLLVMKLLPDGDLRERDWFSWLRQE